MPKYLPAVPGLLRDAKPGDRITLTVDCASGSKKNTQKKGD